MKDFRLTYPEGWEERRLGHVMTEVHRPIRVDADAAYREIGVRSHGRGIFHKEPVLGADLGEKKVFRIEPDDFIFNIVFAWEGAVAIAGSEERGFIASHRFPTFRIHREVADPRYLLWFFMTGYGRFLLEDDSPGSAGRNCTLDRSRLLKERVRLPPLSEQARIARFLDERIPALDETVSHKEGMLDLLAEQRSGFIAEAVRHGNDSGSDVRESRDEWLGRLPAHWKVMKLGWLARIGNGSTPNREDARYWSGAGVPWLNSSKVNADVALPADRWVTPTALTECHLPHVPDGSVLVAITGEGQTRGRAALLAEPATVSQHLAYITLRGADLHPEFLHRQLQGRYEWMRAESSGGGSTKAALTCELLRTIRVAIPPMAEQGRILQRISEHVECLDRCISDATRSIDCLKEYRASLVAAAVAGMIDDSTEAA